jgi:TolA-binding protein
MKVFQKALLLSVLSLGLSYPLLANEGPAVKKEHVVIKSLSDSDPVMVEINREESVRLRKEIDQLEKENDRLGKENNHLERQNSMLQSQLHGLKEAVSVQKKDSSTVAVADLKELQATLKEILAEQKNANALSERQLVISLRGLRS